MKQITWQENMSKLISERTSFERVAAYACLVLIIAASLFYSTNPLIYLIFAITAFILIMPSHFYFGLTAMLLLTMIFEKFFSLEPLVIGQYTIKLYLVDLIMIFTFIALIINNRFGKRKQDIFFGWPEKALFFFLTAVAAYFLYSLSDINSDFSVSFSSLKNYLFYPLIYFLTIYSIQGKEKIKEFVHFFLIVSLLLIAFIAIGIVRSQGLWVEYTALSTEGVRLLATSHALYLSLAVVLLFPLVVFGIFRNKAFPFFIIWIWLFGIIVSYARHLWLMLALVLPAMFLFLPRLNKKIALKYSAYNLMIIANIVLIIFLLAGILYNHEIARTSASLFDNISTRAMTLAGSDLDSSATWRLDIWNISKSLWESSPLLGVGFGKKVLFEWTNWQSFEELRNIHNSPLAILVQMGLLGFGLFATFISSLLFLGFKYLYKDARFLPYYLGILAASIGIIICSFFGTYIEANFTSILLWILLGVLRSSQLAAKDDIA